jgi:hypothetical protein
MMMCEKCLNKLKIDFTSAVITGQSKIDTGTWTLRTETGRTSMLLEMTCSKCGNIEKYVFTLQGYDKYRFPVFKITAKKDVLHK